MDTDAEDGPVSRGHSAMEESPAAECAPMQLGESGSAEAQHQAQCEASQTAQQQHQDVEMIMTADEPPQHQQPEQQQSPTSAQPTEEGPASAAADAHYIHALLPADMKQPPELMVTLSVRKQLGRHRQTQEASHSVVLQEPLHCVSSTPAGLTNLVHWCSGPLVPAPPPPHTSHTYTATVSVHQKTGFFSRTKKHETNLILSPGCRHHYILEASFLKGHIESATADSWGLLLADMVIMLCQQPPGASPSQRAAVGQQLKDLAQQCGRTNLNSQVRRITTSMYHTADSSDSSSDDESDARKHPKKSSEPSTLPSAGVLSAVVLLAQQLPDNPVAQLGDLPVSLGPSACAAGGSSQNTVCAILTAWGALLLLSAPGSATVQRQLQALSAPEQQQVQQSLAMLLRIFSVMGSESVMSAAEHQRQATAAGQPTTCKRSWAQMSDMPAPDGSSSSSGSQEAASWLTALQQTLARSIPTAAATCILSMVNPHDLSWFEAIPAFYNCLEQPSLGFLWAISRRVQQQSGQHTSMNPLSAQAVGKTDTSVLQRYVSACSWVYSRLHAMNPHSASNPQLLTVATTLAPGLPGLMHLVQLPELQQAFGSGAYAGWQLTAAVDAAVQRASLLELLTCWADMSQAMQTRMRAEIQHAAVTALLGFTGNSGSSSSGGGGGAVTATVLAVGSGSVSSTTDEVQAELLYGGLFEGPMQLLLLLVSSSRATSRWPVDVSYKLVPAALQLVLEQQAHSADMSQQQQQSAAVPGAASELEQDFISEQPGLQRKVQPTSAARKNPLILNLVKSWLEHVGITAADVTNSMTVSRKMFDNSSSSSSRAGASTLHLYQAADQVLKHCSSTVWGDVEVDQLLHQSHNTVNSTLSTAEQHVARIIAAADECQCSLLPSVLDVLETAVQQLLQEGQYQTVLSLAGPLAASDCCLLLQQHFFYQLAHQSSVSGHDHHDANQQRSQDYTAAEDDNRGKGAVTSLLAAGLKQRMCSSWQSADLLVSAVLGCEAGGLNISQPAAAAAASGELCRLACSSVGISGFSGADSSWHQVHSRSSKKYKASQQKKQQRQEGVSQLQQWVLVLLLDALLEQQQAELAAAESFAVSATSSNCSIDKVLLLQSFDDLLAGYSLWLRLLQASSTPFDASQHSSSMCSSGKRQLYNHPLLQQVVNVSKQLLSTITSMSFQVAQLQHLRQQQEILEAFAAALAHIEPTSSSPPNCIDTTLTAAADAVKKFERDHQMLGCFYTLLCPVLLHNTAGLEAYAADLACLLTALPNKQLRELSSIWGQHVSVLAAAKLVAPVLHTTPCINSVKLFQQQQMDVIDPANHRRSGSLGATVSELVPGSEEVVGEYDATISPTPPPAGAAPMTVSTACDLVPDLLVDFSSRWARAVGTVCSAGATTVADVLALWVTETLPTPDAVAAQYQQIAEYIQSQQTHKYPSSSSSGSRTSPTTVPAAAVSTLLRLHHNSRDCLLSAQLTALQAVFQLSPSPLLSAAQQLPRTSLLELQVPAARLAAAYDGVEQQLGVLADHPELLSQLGRSESLGEFLTAVGSDDLRRLADGVEDHGDSFVRSAVLSDLIEVNRLLRQLRTLQGQATVEQLLQQVADIAAIAAQQAITHNRNSKRESTASRMLISSSSSPVECKESTAVSSAAVSAACGRLTVQLRSCIEHLHGFKALYKRLSNRGELTREIVVNIIQRGVYHFRTSTAHVSPSAATPSWDCGRRISQQVLVSTVCSYSSTETAAAVGGSIAGSSVQPAATAAPGAPSSSSSAGQLMRQLGIAELQELCSRVQLLVNSSGRSSQGMLVDGMDPMTAQGSASSTSADALLLFIKEVAIVVEVTGALEQLLDLGCLKYRGWHQQVTATHEPSLRFKQLQQLLQLLQQDLILWQQHLSMVQSSCCWLNYFEPCQLFLLDDMLCFWNSPSAVFTDEQRLSALALLQFVEPTLQQLQVDAVIAAHRAPQTSHDVIDLTLDEQDTADGAAICASVEALKQLTKILEALFATGHQTKSPVILQQQQAAQQAASASASAATSANTSAGATAAAGLSCDRLINIVIRDDATSSIDILLQADAAVGHQLLQPSRVLFCSSQTSWWQIQLFMQRCFPSLARQHAAEHSDNTCGTPAEADAKQLKQWVNHPEAVFALCDVDVLPFQQQSKLLHMFQQALEQQQTEHVSAFAARPRLIVTSGGSDCVLVAGVSRMAAAGATVTQAKTVYSSTDHMDTQQTEQGVMSTSAAAMHQILLRQQCSVVVLTSDLPGQGKSATAMKLAAAHQQELYHVLLVDDMQPPCDIIGQLRGWDPQQHILHLQLLGCSNPAVLQQQLFSLLALGHLSEGLSVYHRLQQSCNVVIEVGNSLAESLLHEMPLLAAADQGHGVHVQQLSATAAVTELVAGSGVLLEPGYRRVHCCFNMAHVDISTADMRLLCGYLSLAAAGVLDYVVLDKDGTVQQQYQQHLPSEAQSRQLLQRAFVEGRTALMSYTLLHTFVSVAARQLQHMSDSCFFTPDMLQYALDQQQPRVRSQLLQAIVAAAASFAVESCSAVRSRQHQQLQATAATADAGLQLAARMGSVIGWSESNHLLLLFNSSDEHQTITPLYRHRQHVPDSLQQLLATQFLRSQDRGAGLVDYAALSHQELFDILLQLAAPAITTRQLNTDNSSSCSRCPADAASLSYIMTADNLLKMSFIYLRAQCGLPVVMMGDTGCGKTSLLKFVAAAAGVQLMVLNVHAGTSSREILQAVWDAERAAAGGGEEKQVWLFFDESNTCDHQGLLASVISHRQLPGGQQLPASIIPMAAINPYRLKPSASSSSKTSVAATAGLRGKLPVSHSGLGRLVYTVQPSPEALLDHVCDYGVLSPEDETAYIRAMTARPSSGDNHRCCHLLPQALVVELLCASQQQIRNHGYSWDVSLRDVNRCLSLARWFENNMRNRPRPKRRNKPGQWLARAFGTIGYYLLSTDMLEQAEHQQQEANIQLQGLVLALMHTYHSRLASRAHRLQYLQQLVTVFRRHGKNTTPKELQDILRAEQEDYLKRMELPAGIALNEALRENVFTALVCILNKIPLFLVGKPGSSKSLALRLIYANLRGPESSDDFFKQLPALMVFSYQGSESSTSSGIHKVFYEAKQAGAAAGSGTTPVVLLDEVGLAEISPHNPLQALHALLEPGYPAESPDVAVIGISNWALDAAKMSRAVLLSRPEPELEDLSSTAVTIWQAAHGMTPDAGKCHQLKQIATAYFEQYNRQSIPDFHGLRDYYALISNPRLHPQLSPEQLYRALLRNFGGPADLTRQVVGSFTKQVVPPSETLLPTVDELIADNLNDKTARHLLLISSGDLAVDVVHSCLLIGRSSLTAQDDSSQQLPSETSELVVLWGSPWPDDQSEAYKYSMLSEIILHMELGHKLVLRDFGIFGALYDMLNQNYCTVGGRNNCRVALGPHANPMCTVHDDFRAVVVMSPAQAYAADPSLLNRFEKQWLDCKQLLRVSYRQLLLEPLQQWLQQLVLAWVPNAASSSAGTHSNHCHSSGDTVSSFGVEELMLGYCSDTLPSLLISQRNQRHRQQEPHLGSLAHPQTQQQLMLDCQQQLIRVCSLDGVARACYVNSIRDHSNIQLHQLLDIYLDLPTHSIASFVQHLIAAQQVLQLSAAHETHKAVKASISSTGARPLQVQEGQAATSSSDKSVQLWFLMTRSPRHVMVAPLLQHSANVTELDVSHIKSEREVKQHVAHFLQKAFSTGPHDESGLGRDPSTADAVDATMVGADGHAMRQPAQLLVLHAEAADAAKLRHLRHLVTPCLKAAGCCCLSADSRTCSTVAAAEVASASEAAVSAVPATSSTPMVSIILLVHLPITAAAARAASRLPAAISAPLTAEGTTATRGYRSSEVTKLTPAVATSSGVDVVGMEDSWQCSWMSDWQQFTVDSLEGYTPWVWTVLKGCLRAAASTAGEGAGHQQGGGLAAAAVQAIPVSQLMKSVLVAALTGLPYSNTTAAAFRLKQVAQQLLTDDTGLWDVLQQMVYSRFLGWPGWQSHELLRLAGDLLQLQLHCSYPAAVEAAVTEEIRRLLSELLLGLEQHQVLLAYWGATRGVQQEVHKLLLQGKLSPVRSHEAQPTTPLSSALNLKLPISYWCYKQLQASRQEYELLLGSQAGSGQVDPDGVSSDPDSIGAELSASPNTDDAVELSELSAAEASCSLAGVADAAVIYRLNSLLDTAVGEQLAHQLKQHSETFCHDLLLITLAAETGDKVVGSRPVDDTAVHQMLQLISRYAGDAASQQVRHHPLHWQQLLWQCQPLLQALSQLMVYCTGRHAAAVTQAAPCTDIADMLIQQVYLAQLPTRDHIVQAGGLTVWKDTCKAASAHAAALLAMTANREAQDRSSSPISTVASTLSSRKSRYLTLNLEVLVRLAELFLASDVAAAGADTLIQQLHDLSVLIKEGRVVCTDAELLARVTETAHQIDGASTLQHHRRSATLPPEATAPTDALRSFRSWLLSTSLHALKTDQDLQLTAAQLHPGHSVDIVTAMPVLRLMTEQLLGQHCTAALLHPLVLLLQLSNYALQPLQLLAHVQLLGGPHTNCPVLQCVHQVISGGVFNLESKQAALLATAVQQCFFGRLLLSQPAADDQSALSTAIQGACNSIGPGSAAGTTQQAVLMWIDKAATILCQDHVPVIQLAVIVAFLRSVIDRAAHAAVALATEPAAVSSQQAEDGGFWALVLVSLDKILRQAANHSRLHTLFIYLLKTMKGAQPTSWLQQIVVDISQQHTHPLQSCMAALAARLGVASQEQQHQQQLPIHPYMKMPHYQQIEQLLHEAAAWPEAAAELLRSKVQESASDHATLKALLAATSRQVYFLHCSRRQHTGPLVEGSHTVGSGMFAAAKHLPPLMQAAGADAAAQKLMTALISNTWGCGTSSNTGSSSNRTQQAKCKSLLQLIPDASQKQLHVCSAVIHLALSLVSIRKQTAPAASSPSLAAPGVSNQSGFIAPLMQYLLDPASTKHCYMLGAPADDTMQLISRVSDGTTVYRCACGLPYVIGNCGQPTQSRKCPSPNCRFSLGGQGYGPAAGQTMLGGRGAVPDQQQPGYLNALLPVDTVSSSTPTTSAAMSAATLASGASVGVRELPPSSCQVVRLLVHAALAVGAAAGLQPPGSLSSYVGVGDTAAALQLVEGVVVQQWQMLQRSLQANDEQVLAVLLCTIDDLVAMHFTGIGSSGAAGGAWQITSAADRQSWEQRFHLDVAKRWTSRPGAAVQHMLEPQQPEVGANPSTSTAVSSVKESSYLICAVQEGLTPTSDSNHNSRQLLTLFRTVAEPSLDGLAAYFWADSGNAALYPVTNAVLLEQQQQRCTLLPHMLDLVQFENSVRQSSSCIISRAAAQNTTLADHIKSVLECSHPPTAAAQAMSPTGTPASTFADRSSSSSSSCQASSHVDNQLRAFIKSWNAIRTITRRFECKELVVPELDAATAPLAYACLSNRDEGLLLMAMLTELSQRHNDFLVLATQQQQQQQPAATLDAQHIETSTDANLSTKPVQGITGSDIIDIPAAIQQLQLILASAGSSGLAHSGLEYSTGQTTVFNLSAVEALLHERLVAGKCLLAADTNAMQMFVYQGELSRAAATLLQQVDNRVAQQQQSLKDMSDQAAALISQLPAGCTAAGMLSHLEVLLSFMKKTGGNSSSSVAEYVAAWLPEGFTQQLLMSCELFRTLQLQQVVGLYEGLLDVVAAAVVIEDMLGTSYQQQLDPGQQQQVWRMIDRQEMSRDIASSSKEDQHTHVSGKASQVVQGSASLAASSASSIPAHVVLVVLRRVMLRFLCSSALHTGHQEDQPVPPDMPLSIYCSNFDCCRWPWLDMGCSSRLQAEQLVEDVFPDTLLVAHAVPIAKLLQNGAQ